MEPADVVACATDLGPSGRVAAAWAAHFAARLGMPVRLLHAQGEREPAPEHAEVPKMMRDVVGVYRKRLDEEQASARAELSRETKRLTELGLEVDPQLLEGRASSAIAEELAREPVFLAVLGPHTRLGGEEIAARAFLPFGSTAERVAHEGSAPVFLARAEEPPLGYRLQFLFDLEHTEDAPALEARARALATRLGATFVVVEREADLRAMQDDEAITRVLVTAATRAEGEPGFLFAAPASKRLRQLPYPVLALPRL